MANRAMVTDIRQMLAKSRIKPYKKQFANQKLTNPFIVCICNVWNGLYQILSRFRK